MLTAAFWGGTFIAARAIANRVESFSAAFLRFLIASVVLLLVLYFRNRGFPRVNRKQLVAIIFMGLTGIFFYNYCFFMGLKTIQASRAALIVATNPIFISLFSAYIFKEKLSIVKVCGILISVFGAVLVIARGHLQNIFTGGIGTGELFIFGCVASWVFYSLMSKPVMHTLSPLTTISYSAFVGTLALFFPAYSENVFGSLPNYSALDWVSLTYLGLFGTVLGIIWYLEGIQNIGPGKASQFINLVPVSAIILAILILGEQLTWPISAGALLVIGGVYLTQLSPSRQLTTNFLLKK